MVGMIQRFASQGGCRMKSMWTLAAIGLGLTGALAAAGPIEPPGADLPREGTGDRRADLDAMELKPFDGSLWSELTEWNNGEALTSDGARGKVVLVYTWTSYLPTSLRPISTLSRLDKQFGDEGLVIVGVHPATGWEDAGTQLNRRRGSFRIALDKTGAFRDGLLVDQDPDFYLIDRAGQMRFADLDTSALSRAVEILIGESEEDARTLNDRLASEQAAADEEFGRTRDIRQEVQLSDIPDLPFPEPSADEYAAVKWTILETEEDNNRRRGQEPPAPGSMPAFDDGVFYPAKPNFKGRMTIVYFFNPKAYKSYQYLEEANRMQKAYGRDAVVMGVMTPMADPNNRSRRNAPEIDPEQWAKDFAAFAKTREPKHTLVSDIGGSFATALNANQRSRNNDGGVFATGAMPYVAVVSSDGLIRFHGPAHSRWFQFMLDEVSRLDPGVNSRRAVEEMYRRTQRGG